MTNYLGRFLMATHSAVSAFKYSFANPNTSVASDLCSVRNKQYTLGWQAHTNTVFDDLAFAAYATGNGLYAKTKGVFNPVTRLDYFYAAVMYQGVLTVDARNLPDGEQLAIPLSSGTPDEVRDALGQLWQWGNWRQKLPLWILYGASMGDNPLEAVENVEYGRVYPKVIPPGHIIDVQFDDRDNVTAYVKEYRYYDADDARQYVYKKEVSRETIREYRDDKPHDYGNGEAYDNPYGFAPLVWNSHRFSGTLPGSPAIRSWNKIERINSFATRVENFLKVQSQSPNVLFLERNSEVNAVSQDATKASEDELKVLQVNGAGSVDKLEGNLNMGEALEWAKLLIEEVERDHPEVTMFPELRSMGDVSGKAVELLLGDVKGYVNDARANYDSAQERLFKQLLTIGGMRANERAAGWKDLSDQQKKFLPFNLESYARGELDFEIMARPLLPKSNLQISEEKEARYSAIKAGIDVGEPLEYQYKRDGMSDEEWGELQQMQQTAKNAKLGEVFRSADDPQIPVEL